MPARCAQRLARRHAWRGKARPAINASGYVAHALEAALWSVGRAGPDFDRVVLLAANLGQDADTTAAIAGQLAGAFEGVAGIPNKWLDRLAWRDRIFVVASQLAANGMFRHTTR